MKYRSHFEVAKLVEFQFEVNFKSISSHFRVKSSQLSWYKRLPGLLTPNNYYMYDVSVPLRQP